MDLLQVYNVLYKTFIVHPESHLKVFISFFGLQKLVLY